MSHCPSCRSRLTPQQKRCACGFDLQLVSDAFHKLTQPPSGAIVLPFAAMKKMTKAGRRAVSQAISRARGN